MSDTNISLGAKKEIKIGQLVEESGGVEPKQPIQQTQETAVAEADENTDTDVAEVEGVEVKDIADTDNVGKEVEPEGAQPDAEQEDGTEKSVKVTDDDILSFLKEKGINVESTDDVINRLKPQPTKEESDAAERQQEVERIKAYVDNGGSVEEYNAIKEAATTKLSDLSLKIEKENLLRNGFSESEIESILSDEYFMSEFDDAYFEENGYTDEEKALFLKKQKYFKNKLSKSAEYIQQMAKDELDRLDQERNRINAEKVQRKNYSSKVDEYLKNFNRVEKLDIGKVNDKDVQPVEYQVSDSDLRTVGDILKNPDKVKQLFFNTDGTPKMEVVAGYLLAKQTESSKIKTAFFEGGSRQAEIIKNTFGASPYDIGVGGSQQSTHKQPAALGKPRKVPINTQ